MASVGMIEKAATKRLTLGELAEWLGLELRGDARHVIDAVGTLSGAGDNAITFLANRAYRRQLPGTRAGVVILSDRDAGACPVHCLVSDDPYASYARAAKLFDRRPQAHPGIHPTAVIDDAAELGDGVHVGPHAVIGAGSRIGDGCVVGPGCIVGPGAILGPGTRLLASVTLMDGVRLGRRVLLHAGAVIGADGFGIAMTAGHWEKVPQLGGVRIGDDCEIGANSAVDRGAIEDTVLEEDVRIDNLVQIGHNCHIGAHTAIAGCSALAGSVRIGRYCLLGGGTAVSGHVEIADRVTLAAKSILLKSVREEGSTWSSSIPARPLRDWRRTLARLNRLDRPHRGADNDPKKPKEDEES